MKKIFNYIALATLTLSAVACSQEDLTSLYFSDSKAVHISAQIGANEATGEFITRSNPIGEEAQQKMFAKSDKISVKADDQEAIIYILGDNNTWTPNGNQYLKWKQDKMQFTAYYPVNANNASATTFSIPQSYNSIDDLANADYMIYSGEQNNASGNGVTLSMKRKMVRFVFTTTFKNQYDETNYEVSSITIHSNTKGYSQSAVEDGNLDVISYKNQDKFYALLAPTKEDANATFLTIKVKNKATQVEESLTVKGIPTTSEGTSYEINLTVGKDKANIGNVTVTDWNTGKVISGQAIEKTTK